jgi:hypothetical protein
MPSGAGPLKVIVICTFGVKFETLPLASVAVRSTGVPITS